MIYTFYVFISYCLHTGNIFHRAVHRKKSFTLVSILFDTENLISFTHEDQFHKKPIYLQVLCGRKLTETMGKHVNSL